VTIDGERRSNFQLIWYRFIFHLAFVIMPMFDYVGVEFE
jgi:hypothetical protein